jgi:putative Mg2+ transporter-C (MgtC) family protein
MDFSNELKSLGLLVIAMILGGAIGFERELAEKPAGMRTHMLMAGATALLVMVGHALVQSFAKFDGLARADEMGIIAATVTGVSFLGAGTIIRQGSQTPVEGLTTAASLLFTAVIGICVSVGEMILAVGATLLALLTLRAVHVIEIRMKRHSAPPHKSSDDSPKT